MDLIEDKHNCGACKNKCKFTNSCCRGECVNLAYDKRHCGSCGNKCMPGGYCIYGLCNYA
ncbi:putative stigma-specific protein Stig1 [Helianthus debilis subsp. tardiflorus]